ncbi:MAG: hypothetical protein CM15mV41_0030 [Caudoviricetes sp.]|nr:MAG: hypothetical protein CM15mV41_0030 [Caudoviricetes sp.]
MKLQCDWEYLGDALWNTVRHSTLSAQMPSESSSVVSNATNGIEPPRATCPLRRVRKGPLKQIVPSYSTLKGVHPPLGHAQQRRIHQSNCYYAKFFDKRSVVTGYNQRTIHDNEVPVSEMAKDLLTTYKYGWKTSYYQNTYDAKKDGMKAQGLMWIINRQITQHGGRRCDVVNRIKKDDFF